MRVIYYVELNLICIVVLFLCREQLRFRYERYSADKRVFDRLIWTSILLCTSEMVAGACRGQSFPGARAILEISNLIFIEAITVTGYLWMRYVYLRLKVDGASDRRKNLYRAIPLLLFTIFALSNPFTHFLFSIDENNLYARSAGVYFHWVVSWLYLMVPTLRVVRMLIGEKSRQKRQDILPFLYFIIAPIVASLVQMLFYGVSSSQAGITISIVMICLSEKNNQIQKDSLTGLNNRRGLNKYFESLAMHNGDAELAAWMIDVNSFKQVNDRFGHAVGDRALLDMADVLKLVCAKTAERLFLCRYGGDEFLLVGSGRSPEDGAQLKSRILHELENRNRQGDKPYVLEVSIGMASGLCADFEDFERLIHAADEAMYNDKKRLSDGITPSA
ncbi:MAG: GGDEF domain-containing protein [Clostridia bacterium]|nr:GGDEF domain-containing protein [Clostridia bacterium]